MPSAVKQTRTRLRCAGHACSPVAALMQESTKHQAFAPLIKVMLGATVLTPMQHSVLFSSHALFDGASISEAVERTAKMLPKSVPTSWGFWIPVQFVTFTAIAPPLRIAWVSTVSLIWNVILSGFNGAA